MNPLLLSLHLLWSWEGFSFHYIVFSLIFKANSGNSERYKTREDDVIPVKISARIEVTNAAAKLSKESNKNHMYCSTHRTRNCLYKRFCGSQNFQKGVTSRRQGSLACLIISTKLMTMEDYEQLLFNGSSILALEMHPPLTCWLE